MFSKNFVLYCIINTFLTRGGGAGTDLTTGGGGGVAARGGGGGGGGVGSLGLGQNRASTAGGLGEEGSPF